MGSGCCMLAYVYVCAYVDVYLEEEGGAEEGDAEGPIGLAAPAPLPAAGAAAVQQHPRRTRPLAI